MKMPRMYSQASHSSIAASVLEKFIQKVAAARVSGSITNITVMPSIIVIVNIPWRPRHNSPEESFGIIISEAKKKLPIPIDARYGIDQALLDDTNSIGSIIGERMCWLSWKMQLKLLQNHNSK